MISLIKFPLGNTCYANSALQALFYTPSFGQRLRTLSGLTCGDESVAPLVHELLRVYNAVEADDARLLANAANLEAAPSSSRRKREDRVQMSSLFARMGAVDSRFCDPRKQQDVQEFLRFLLGYLQDFELSLRNTADTKLSTESPSDPMQVEPTALEPATPGKRRRASSARPSSPMPAAKRARTSPDESSSLSTSVSSTSASSAETHVGRLFQGDLESTLQCLRCKYVSRTREPFLDLSLTVEKDKALTDSLKVFMAEERLTGADRYHCPRCDTRTDAIRHLRFASLPAVLTFHLKRFTFDEVKRKVTHHITTPLELSLERFTTPDCFNRLRKYELYAIIFHKGTSSACGHYVTVLRDPKLDPSHPPTPPEAATAPPAATLTSDPPQSSEPTQSAPTAPEPEAKSTVRPSPNPKANWVPTAPLTRRQRSALEQINNYPVPGVPPEQAARSATSGTRAEMPSRSRKSSAASNASAASLSEPSSPRGRSSTLRWVVFDDEDVTFLPTHQLTTLLSSQSKSLNTAYILFYKQVFAE